MPKYEHPFNFEITHNNYRVFFYHFFEAQLEGNMSIRIKKFNNPLFARIIGYHSQSNFFASITEFNNTGEYKIITRLKKKGNNDPI